MTISERLRAALARRLRGPYLALGGLDARMHQTEAMLTDLMAISQATLDTSREARDVSRQTHDLLSGEMRAILRALAAEEAANRRALDAMRGAPDYRAPWTEERPLVSVTVTTRDRAELLRSRSLPSILGQSYTELEVIVVGDDADHETEQVVRELNDPRVSFFNLPLRLPISEDTFRRWLVAATLARNEANRRARGRWVVQFDDDDALRPDCVERLLERARHDELEVVYGRVEAQRSELPPLEIGKFPPELGQFTWAAGMFHTGLRFLHRQLFASDLGLPGDWYLAERMLRAGVRFGMVDAVLADIYPSPMNRVGEPPAGT